MADISSIGTGGLQDLDPASHAGFADLPDARNPAIGLLTPMGIREGLLDSLGVVGASFPGTQGALDLCVARL